MTLNDPIVLWAIGAAAAASAWIIRTWIIRQDKRVDFLETRVSELETRMAAHDGGKELLDRMYSELQRLTQLTHRIAGHLNIS